MPTTNNELAQILKFLDAQRPIAPSDATRVEPGQVEERYPGYPHSMWSAEDRDQGDPRFLGKMLSESKYLPVPAHGDEDRYRENVKKFTDTFVPQTYGDIALEAAGGKLVSGGMLVAAVLGKYGKRAAQIASGKVKKLYNDKIGLKRKDPGVSSNDLFTELPSDNRTMAEMIADMDATQIQDASDDILQRMDISPEEAKQIARGDPENRFVPRSEAQTQQFEYWNNPPAIDQGSIGIQETYIRQSQRTADEWAISPEGQEAFADVAEQWSSAPSEVYNPGAVIPRSTTKGSYRTNVPDLKLENPTGTHKISRKSAPNRKDHGEILVDADAPEQWNQYQWGESLIDEASVPSNRKGYRKHTFTVRHKAAVEAMDETHDIHGKLIKKSQQAPILARMSFETKVMPNGEVHIKSLTFYKHGPQGGKGTSWTRADMQQLPPELQKRYGWDPSRPERKYEGVTQGDWNYREGMYDIQTRKEVYPYVDELGRSTDYAEIGGGKNAAQIMRMTFSRMPENWVLSTADNSFTMDSWTNLVKSVMREAAELHIHDDFMLVSPSSNSRFSKMFDKLKRENLGDERVAIETVVKEMAVEWEKMVGRTTRQGMKVSGSEMKFLPKVGEETSTGSKTLSKAKASHFTFKGMKTAMAALFGIKVSQLDEFLGQFEEVDERNHLVR